MSDPCAIVMRVFNQINQIHWSDWEAIRDQDNLLTDYHYLKALEESDVLDCQYQYFEFYSGERLVCTMCGYLVMYDFAQFISGPPRTIILAIRKLFPGFLNHRTLEIGSPVSLGTTISYKPEITLTELAAILRLLVKHVKESKVKLIVVRDFNEEKLLVEDALIKLGFKEALNYPVGKIKIIWNTFDQYLYNMKKNYRKAAKRKIEHKEKYGIQTVYCNDEHGLEYLKDYVELYNNVRERSKDFPREFVGEKYHIAMTKHMGRDNYWLQYLKDNRLVAFSHFIVYKGHMVSLFTGMDYEVSHEAMLYFNSFYDEIRFAIENGIRSIEIGVTTYEEKTSAGYSVFPQRMYVWHKSLLFQFMMNLALDILDFDSSECHYVFHDDQHQYFWDGKSKYAPEEWIIKS